MMNRLYIVAAMLLTTLAAKAQFTVVDAESKESLPGVFVFSEKGALLTMSDENGVVKALDETVTLSMMSYESKTIDARGLTGNVELSEKPHELPNVVIGKPEYLKISATFRDVITNYDSLLVVYREGLADYYYDAKTKRYKRFIRACRQMEHPLLRKFGQDSLKVFYMPVMDYDRLSEMQRTGEESVQGDTTFVAAKYKNRNIDNGIMNFERDGRYHVVIDAIKFLKRNSVSFLGMHFTLNKHIIDWQYGDKPYVKNNIIAMRAYREEDFTLGKSSPNIPITTTSEFVVNNITSLTRAEAREEMKDKEIATEFTTPDCLPSLPPFVLSQTKNLVLKKFRER